MGFSERLEESLRSRPTWTPRPEVLLLPQIPKPMHQMTPRTILGNKWWNETRQAAYESTDYHCIACQVHKSQAKGPKWLEGHEVYKTDYKKGRLIYIETVPLCNFCHNYIHQGRLQALLDAGEITATRFVAIIQHGESILSIARLSKSPVYNGRMAEWSKWRLVLFGKMYRPKFKSLKEWTDYFGEGK